MEAADRLVVLVAKITRQLRQVQSDARKSVSDQALLLEAAVELAAAE